MITIVRAVRTSIACPAQWDLWDDEGSYYYARFRHGCGAVRQYKTENWTEAPDLPDDQVDKTQPGWFYRANSEYIGLVATFEDEDEWRGWIELEEFCARAGLTLDPACAREGYGDYVLGKLAEEGIIAGPGSELAGIAEKWNEVAGG